MTARRPTGRHTLPRRPTHRPGLIAGATAVALPLLSLTLSSPAHAEEYEWMYGSGGCQIVNGECYQYWNDPWLSGDPEPGELPADTPADNSAVEKSGDVVPGQAPENGGDPMVTGEDITIIDGWKVESAQPEITVAQDAVTGRWQATFRDGSILRITSTDGQVGVGDLAVPVPSNVSGVPALHHVPVTLYETGNGLVITADLEATRMLTLHLWSDDQTIYAVAAVADDARGTVETVTLSSTLNGVTVSDKIPGIYSPAQP